MGGGTASGKTTLRKKVVPQLLKKKKVRAISVDPDDIKEEMPQYQLLKEQQSLVAASLVHKKSRQLCHKVLSSFIKRRKHFIYEGTMAKPKCTFSS
ncbi:zeta toxin family protein [Salipaludibacillus sp. CF4.18]|uniref:zeta toxin family protein n=1 Tax=Salipaludibacillus sp. CF4.18 TaxID=3373081 RepID=UPI003EE66F93